MKKVLYFLFLIVLFVPSINASEYIKSINMNIYVDEYGTADITEEWNTRLETGTEMYKTFNNLNSSYITDFKVSLNGIDYTYNDQWSTSMSFNEKAYNCGINKLYDGIELCFGISKYGENNYKLKYKINNFVEKLIDSDVIYYRLMPPNIDPSPENVKITIKTYYDLNENNSQIWAYGFNGQIIFFEGSIILETENSLNKKEYMTPLIKLEKGKFNTNASRNITFDELKKQSRKGIYNLENFKKTDLYQILEVIYYVIIIIIVIFSPLLMRLSLTFIVSVFDTIAKLIRRKITYNRFINKDLNKYEYYRDINVDDILVIAAYSLVQGYLYDEGNLIDAALLKLYNDRDISIEYNNQTRDYVIDITNMKTINLDTKSNEPFIYRMSYNLSSIAKDNKVYKKDLRKLFIKSGKTTIRYQLQEYYNHSLNIVKPNSELEKKLFGLVRFIRDFSLMEDKEVKEVKLWNDYLVIATAFGIAKKVNNRLNNPNFIEFSKLKLDFSYMSNSSRVFESVSNKRKLLFAARSSNSNMGNTIFSGRFGGSSFSRGSGGSSFSGGGSHASGGGSSRGGGGRR